MRQITRQTDRQTGQTISLRLCRSISNYLILWRVGNWIDTWGGWERDGHMVM